MDGEKEKEEGERVDGLREGERWGRESDRDSGREIDT